MRGKQPFHKKEKTRQILTGLPNFCTGQVTLLKPGTLKNQNRSPPFGGGRREPFGNPTPNSLTRYAVAKETFLDPAYKNRFAMSGGQQLGANTQQRGRFMELESFAHDIFAVIDHEA